MDVHIDGLDHLYETVTDMLKKIDHFKAVDIGAEMSAWQTEDMHRHRPFTMRSRRAGRATTKIRPHSLYEMKHSRSAQRRFLRRARKLPYVADYRHWSTRPILRDELEQRLVDRMTTLLNEKITWA
jgi:hypothetical protein